MKNRLLNFQAFTLASVLSLFATVTSAEIVFVSDDTMLLTNGIPTEDDPADGEASFGGRNDVTMGFRGTDPRHGLFRFDVSSLAAQINDPTLRVVSADFLINEIDGQNFDLPAATFNVFPVVASNSGWLEGISAASTNAYDGDGNASFTYHTSPTGSATNTDGQLWASAGGGPTGTFPSPNGFTFETDTGSSIGSGSIATLDNGMNDLLSISLNPSTRSTICLAIGWQIQQEIRDSRSRQRVITRLYSNLLSLVVQDSLDWMSLLAPPRSLSPLVWHCWDVVPQSPACVGDATKSIERKTFGGGLTNPPER